MDLSNVIAELGLSESTDLLGQEWESSQQSMPAEGLPFLAPEFVRNAAHAVGLSGEQAAAAATAAQRIAANASLRALAWHCHYCCFRSNSYKRRNLADWPPLTPALREDSGLFYLLMTLSGLPHMQGVHTAHSVPAQVVRDTLSQVSFLAGEYRKEHGHWGLNPNNLCWLMNHFHGELYQLGRLQFQFGAFKCKFRVFRHQRSRTVLAFPESGVCFLVDGQLSGPGYRRDTGGAWTAELTVTDHEISGHPVLPEGRVLQRRISLPRAEWLPVLAAGEPVLNIHMSGGSPLDYDRCGESFRTALEFFPSHFPKRPFVAFCCCSWLLDTQLQEFLPAGSNIVRFQREFYLFPHVSNDQHLWHRAFGRVPDDLSTAPQDTSLQRALIQHSRSGNHLRARAGGCFLFPEDFDWGSEFYQEQQFEC